MGSTQHRHPRHVTSPKTNRFLAHLRRIALIGVGRSSGERALAMIPADCSRAAAKRQACQQIPSARLRLDAMEGRFMPNDLLGALAPPVLMGATLARMSQPSLLAPLDQGAPGTSGQGGSSAPPRAPSFSAAGMAILSRAGAHGESEVSGSGAVQGVSPIIVAAGTSGNSAAADEPFANALAAVFRSASPSGDSHSLPLPAPPGGGSSSGSPLVSAPAQSAAPSSEMPATAPVGSSASDPTKSTAGAPLSPSSPAPAPPVLSHGKGHDIMPMV